MRNIAIQQFTCTVLDFTKESYLDPICPISLLLDHIDQPLSYFLVFTNHNPCIYGISGEYFHIENVLARVRWTRMSQLMCMAVVGRCGCRCPQGGIVCTGRGWQHEQGGDFCPSRQIRENNYARQYSGRQKMGHIGAKNGGSVAQYWQMIILQ